MSSTAKNKAATATSFAFFSSVALIERQMMCPRTATATNNLAPRQRTRPVELLSAKSNFSELKIGPRIYATVQKQIAVSREKNTFEQETPAAHNLPDLYANLATEGGLLWNIDGLNLIVHTG